jgi:hypothetical protein
MCVLYRLALSASLALPSRGAKPRLPEAPADLATDARINQGVG